MPKMLDGKTLSFRVVSTSTFLSTKFTLFDGKYKFKSLKLVGNSAMGSEQK